MGKDWSCTVCGEKVSWGTTICPLCGSVLEWEEEDEDDPLAYLLPYDPDTWSDTLKQRKRRVRRFAIGAIALGLLGVVVGAASGTIVWQFLLAGLALIASGVYGLVTLPNRYL